MLRQSKITPFLWFDRQAEEAAKFYVGLFPDSRIVDVARYPEAGKEQHGGEPGSVMTVAFELAGQSFTALNGGSHFKLNEAVSFVINCDDQAEVDRYWKALGEGGPPEAQQCGWIKDRFGLSWQVIPRRLIELFTAGDKAQSNRVMAAMLQMKKIDIAGLERAAKGE